MCCPSKDITIHMSVSGEVCVFMKNLPICFASSENDAVIRFPHVYSEHGDCGCDSRSQQLLQGRKLQKTVWWILPCRGKSLGVCAAVLKAEQPHKGPLLDCLLSWLIICLLRDSSGNLFDSFPVTMSLSSLPQQLCCRGNLSLPFESWSRSFCFLKNLSFCLLLSYCGSILLLL